jgi:hypothetical protein
MLMISSFDGGSVLIHDDALHHGQNKLLSGARKYSDGTWQLC